MAASSHGSGFLSLWTEKLGRVEEWSQIYCRAVLEENPFQAAGLLMFTWNLICRQVIFINCFTIITVRGSTSGFKGQGTLSDWRVLLNVLLISSCLSVTWRLNISLYLSVALLQVFSLSKQFQNNIRWQIMFNSIHLQLDIYSGINWAIMFRKEICSTPKCRLIQY